VHSHASSKGSTVNRSVAEKLEYWDPKVALKDNDLHHRISIGPRMKALFLKQAEIDAKVCGVAVRQCC